MKEAARRQWSERLRQERIRNNWRQQDLADQLETTVITVKRWERGRQLPSSYLRQKLCDHCSGTPPVKQWIASSQRRETALRLSGTLVGFWAVRGSPYEAHIWLEQALEKGAHASVPTRVKALSGASWFAFVFGEMDRAKQLGEECLQLYQQGRETSSIPGLSSALYWIGWFAKQQENEGAVHFLLEESRALAREGNKQTLGILLYFLTDEEKENW
jgi:transcriptional regulator with XRE-family HTH domain